MTVGLIQSSSKGILKCGTDCYDYEPLDTQRNEIRLLAIKPSLRSRSPIRFSLRVISLEESPLPKYVALSYCWGHGQADHPVYCDGSAILVTSELLDALRSLRKLTRRYLWIDQICINQADLEERNSQVQLMRRIYAGAVKTFLHLGPSNDFHPYLVNFVKFVSRFISTDEWEPLARKRWLARLLLKFGLGRTKSRLNVFYDRPCFDRVWIPQEVSLSPKTEVICRNVAIGWQQFILIVYDHSAEDLKDGKALPPMNHGSFIDFYAITSTGSNLRANTLWKLLALSNGLRASDPRDQLYALLGLASDAEHLPSPDYQVSVANVYQSFASAFISQGHGPDILALASRRTSDRRYPSWVPDWEQRFIGLRLEESSSFSAGGHKGTFHVQTRKLVLSTEGLIVDTILQTFSREVEFETNIHGIFEGLVDLVSSTTRAIQNDSQRLGDVISWSSVADLHLMLILHLVLDYDGRNVNSDAVSRTKDMYRLDQSVADFHYSGPKADFTNMTATQKAEDDHIRETLAEHLERGYEEEGFSCWGYLQGLAQRGRFAVTTEGRLCLMPLDVHLGDKIAVILGCRAPYVLREDGDGFLSIGETYIRGLMHGEALNDGRYAVGGILIH